MQGELGQWLYGDAATRAFTAGGDARYYGSDGGVRLVSSWPKMRGGYAFVPPPLATAQLDSYATWRDAVGGELAFEDCAMRAVRGLEPCYDLSKSVAASMLEPVDGAVLNLESLVLHAEGLYAQGATAIGDEPVGQDRVLAMEAVAREHAERRRLGLDAWALAARRGRAKDGGPLVTTPDPAIDAFRLRLDVAVGGEVQPLDDDALSVLDGDAAAANAPRHFHGDGSEGCSLSFGDLPAGAPSEHGVGGGLRLAFLTRLGRLVAKYADTELHAGALPTPTFGGGADVPLLLERRAGRGLTPASATRRRSSARPSTGRRSRGGASASARATIGTASGSTRNVESSTAGRRRRAPAGGGELQWSVHSPMAARLRTTSPKLSSAAPAGNRHGARRSSSAAAASRRHRVPLPLRPARRGGNLPRSVGDGRVRLTTVGGRRVDGRPPPRRAQRPGLHRAAPLLVPRAPSDPRPHTARRAHPRQHDGHHPRRAPRRAQRGRCAHPFTAGVLDDGAAAGSFAAGTVGAALCAAPSAASPALAPTSAAPTANPTSTRARVVPTASALRARRTLRRWEPFARLAAARASRAPPTSASPAWAPQPSRGPATTHSHSRGQENKRAARTRSTFDSPTSITSTAATGRRCRRRWSRWRTRQGRRPLHLSRAAAAARPPHPQQRLRRVVGQLDATPPTASAVAPPTAPAEGGNVVVSGGFGVDVPSAPTMPAAACCSRARHWAAPPAVSGTGRRGGRSRRSASCPSSVAANVTNGTVLPVAAVRRRRRASRRGRRGARRRRARR